MLYIIATPIGNLEDISERALTVLRDADTVFCEDTRVTVKLFNRYEIKTPLKSLHRHSSPKKLKEVARLCASSKKIAYVSDGGTPGVSDPGRELIKEILEINKEENIIPIPGPSAVVSAASVCGFPMERFVFLGFPPKKKKRTKFFEELLSYPYPVVFYESPHGLIKTLGDISSLEKGREIAVLREMTKIHEKTYRGTVEEVMEILSKEKIKGEFTLVLN